MKVLYNGKTIDIKDKIIQQVILSFIERSEKGIEEYKTTLEENDKGLVFFLEELQNELKDGVNYIQKILNIISDESKTVL